MSRSEFDISPEQYHAGLDKLWAALGVTGVQEQDVFTLAAAEITRLRQTPNWETSPLDDGTLGYIASEISHDLRCEHKPGEGEMRIRWNNRAAGMLLKTIEYYRTQLQSAESELDPPVCRLQFPDGTVPGNAREAAEGWKRWYDKKAILPAYFLESRSE